ncbi:hypothetical protein GUJ93_ZPchr0002g25220 [Zizania palustris]|uniref:Uncharacterized protein n=1 Tax=Zizania palustris TaxID=103762 RepID=A0A8J5RIP9_ZIZPA|nr:hypothetical protein GUJ93_ZPchr0002g25220 [Zizania palustris]
MEGVSATLLPLEGAARGAGGFRGGWRRLRRAATEGARAGRWRPRVALVASDGDDSVFEGWRWRRPRRGVVGFEEAMCGAGDFSWGRRHVQRAATEGDGALATLQGPRVAPTTLEGDSSVFNGSRAPSWWLRRGRVASSKRATCPTDSFRGGHAPRRWLQRGAGAALYMLEGATVVWIDWGTTSGGGFGLDRLGTKRKEKNSATEDLDLPQKIQTI